MDNHSSEEISLLQYALQLDAVRQIGLELAAELDLETLLNSILTQASRLLEGELGGLYLYKSELDALQLAAGLDTFNIPIGTILKVGEGLAGKVWQSGKALTIDNYEQWEGKTAEWAHVVGAAATIGTPIRWRQEMQGVIILATQSGKCYNHTDIELLRLLAAQAAIAIQNARMINQLQQHSQKLEKEIAERKKAETRLREAERRYKALFTQTNDAIFIIDTDLKIPSDEWQYYAVNQHAADMLGYTHEELIGMSVAQIVAPEDWNDVQAKVQTLAETINIPVYERLLRKKDGSVIWVEVNSAQVYDENGDPEYILSIVREITERKMAEAQLKAYAQELERSNKELEDFAQIASHDLQEPLRKIMTFTNRLLTRDNSTFDKRELLYLKRMYESSNRMQNLVKDTLTLANVRGQAIPFVKVDLMQILQETIADLENQIEQVNGRIHINNPLPTIHADPTQMRQLFQNLLNNALKFHKPEQSPIIHIGAKQLSLDDDGQNPNYQLTIEDNSSAKQLSLADSGQNPYYQLTIEDNGIGFEEKYKTRIFDVLQRLHGRDQYEGSGIGLAVCQRIVERHHGQINVQSQPGIGTTFIITLPQFKLVDNLANNNQ